MTDLPKELPVLTDGEAIAFLEVGLNFDHKPESRSEIERMIQRNADQLLYDALWEKLEKLEA